MHSCLTPPGLELSILPPFCLFMDLHWFVLDSRFLPQYENMCSELASLNGPECAQYQPPVQVVPLVPAQSCLESRPPLPTILSLWFDKPCLLQHWECSFLSCSTSVRILDLCAALKCQPDYLQIITTTCHGHYHCFNALCHFFLIRRQLHHQHVGKSHKNNRVLLQTQKIYIS